MTRQPIGIFSRSLKFEIDFLARVITAFWPTIASRSFATASTSFASCVAWPTPDVDGDLLEPRHLHHVPVAEALHQGGDDVVLVRHGEPGHHAFVAVPLLAPAPWVLPRRFLRLLACGPSACGLGFSAVSRRSWVRSEHFAALLWRRACGASCPSVSSLVTFVPTRVTWLLFGSSSITLETWMGASRCTMPALRVLLVRPGVALDDVHALRRSRVLVRGRP